MNAAPLEPVVLNVLRALWRAQWNQRSAETGGRLTMQELLRQTASSLTLIQLALEELSRRHCTIDRTPAGVRLTATGLECWRDVLEDFSQRHDLRLGRRVLVFGKTDSTNDVASQCAAAPDSHGLVVLADQQTAGRGRLGHRWQSNPGQSVLISIVLRDPGLGESIDRLTLVAGLATAVAIERAAERIGAQLAGIQIKWPNDLLSGGRKIAGILVEHHRDAEGGHIVLGIGINVLQTRGDFSPDLQPAATSLFQETALTIDRTLVAASLLDSVDEHLRDLIGGTAWVDAWKRRCGILGKKVNARSGNLSIRGEVIDVEPLHGLVLRDDLGGTHFLSSQISTLE